MSTPRSLCGSWAGSRIAVTLILPQAHVDGVAVDRDDAREAAVHAVVAQQMGVGLHRAQVVDRHHLDVAPGVFDDRPQHQPADAAKAVDGDANGHA